MASRKANKHPYLTVLDDLTIPSEIESSLFKMADIKSQEETNADENLHNVSTALNYYPADAGSPIPVIVGKYVVLLLSVFHCYLADPHTYRLY